MPRSPKPLLLAAALTSATLVAPAAAHAAEAFVGVTGGNQLVRFSSDTIPGLSAAACRSLPKAPQRSALRRTARAPV